MAAMALDNRSAHKKTDPHAGWLCGIERVEQLSGARRLEARARVLDTQTRTAVGAARGSHDDLTWVISDSIHRLDRVAKQIDNDLLKLHSVSDNHREIGCQLERDRHASTLYIVPREQDRFVGHLVQIHGLWSSSLRREERAESHHHFRCTDRIAHRQASGFTSTVDVRRAARQKAKTGTRVRHDA
jgi:hypothetical protein